MAKQKAPERQLAPAHKVTMQRVRLHVRACACVCACARSCLCDCLQSVHTCAKLCNALAVVCMHASLLVCSPIKHTPLVCVLQLSLFSCPQHTQTLRHTHTLVGIWAGICIGSMALVSGVHKKRRRAVIQTQPLVSFLGMCCVCECVCVCALSRDTVVVLSGLRNGTLQPRFPRSLAQHATVTARQLALRLLRGVRSQHYVSECVCVCIVVVCVCLFLYDWVCSNVAQMYESEILPGVYNVFLLRL